MNAFLLLLFLASSGAVAYAYFVYPVLIGLFSKLFGRDIHPPVLDQARLPSVSLLIAAHDEDAVICARIQNALALDYPPGKLQIIVANDGSTDRTAEIVRSFGQRVTLLDYPVNRGKAATLNAAMPSLIGEIVILSDANTAMDADAALHLVKWFAVPGVGVVCGKLKIVDPKNGSNCDSLYWRFETYLKRCENRLGALLGSNGAIYAIRRTLLNPIPESTIVDDFVIPLRAKLQSGCRIAYDEQAVGTEEAALCVRDEFKRRARIGAGGFQAIGMLRRLLSPRFGWTAFAFVSHKVLRWLCPILMLGTLLSSALLAGQSIAFQFIVVAQVLFYALAVSALLVPNGVRLPRVVRLVAMFVSINTALLIGFVRWLRGSQRGVWQRTQRVVGT